MMAIPEKSKEEVVNDPRLHWNAAVRLFNIHASYPDDQNSDILHNYSPKLMLFDFKLTTHSKFSKLLFVVIEIKAGGILIKFFVFQEMLVLM